MTFQFQSLLKASNMLSQICAPGEDGVLAIITGVVGPSYRPDGATMGIHSNSTQRSVSGGAWAPYARSNTSVPSPLDKSNFGGPYGGLLHQTTMNID